MAVKSVTVKFLAKQQQFCESFGNSATMALLSPKRETLHWPVHCKDFITDAFWSEANKKETSIYDFAWQPGRLDTSTDWFRMLLLSPNEKTHPIRDKAETLQGFLNEIEEKLDFVKSIVYPITEVEGETKKPKDGLMVKFNKAWTEGPLRVSLFTALLRFGLGYTTGSALEHIEKVAAKNNTPWGPMDMNLACHVKKCLPEALKAGKLTTGKKFTEISSVSYAHRGGMMSYKSFVN